MRLLNIKNSKLPEQAINAIAYYKKQAEGKEISEIMQITLLNEIRRGNRDAIPKLVDSWETKIIRIIEREAQGQIENKSILFEKMISVGRLALTALAERELGSTGRERFFRFGHWWVRQAIIKELNQQGKL